MRLFFPKSPTVRQKLASSIKVRRTLGDLEKKCLILRKKFSKIRLFLPKSPSVWKKTRKKWKNASHSGRFWKKKSHFWKKPLKNETFFTKISQCATHFLGKKASFCRTVGDLVKKSFIFQKTLEKVNFLYYFECA